MPAVWDQRLQMKVDDVWNGFFLHSLMLDHAERDNILELEHHVSSDMRRLQPALRARTWRMRGTGQEEWNHTCDLCAWHYMDENDINRMSLL